MTQPNLTEPCTETWDPTYPCPLPVGSEAVSGIALGAATNVLWSLSGRQFGLCTETLRPCRSECYEGAWPSGWAAYGTATGASGWPFPALVGGQWFNLACGGCAGDCSCSSVSEAVLPGPVHDIVAVRVDGVELTPGTDYRVDNGRLLVRLGGDEWPLCNDLNLADTEVGTWSVTSQVGKPVPPLGQIALGILTIEMVKALMCDASCALPKPVQSITRQGVSVTFLDASQVVGIAQTGLYIPDLFINTYNPGHQRMPPKVYDIDRPPRYPGVPSVV